MSFLGSVRIIMTTFYATRVERRKLQPTGHRQRQYLLDRMDVSLAQKLRSREMSARGYSDQIWAMKTIPAVRW